MIKRRNIIYSLMLIASMILMQVFSTSVGSIEANGSALSSPINMTVGKLKELKQTEDKAPIHVPMYLVGDIAVQGQYAFTGGNIQGISDVVRNGLTHLFVRAEIRIKEGGTSVTYPIDYYDKVNGKFYYAVAKTSGSTQDNDIAHEVPQGASVAFMFGLNTQEYAISIVNNKKSEGFKVELLSGINTKADGSFSAQSNKNIKVKLTYPAGYYRNAPVGKKAVGIHFSDARLTITKEEKKDESAIIYSFALLDQPITLSVEGDFDTSIQGLNYIRDISQVSRTSINGAFDSYFIYNTKERYDANGNAVPAKPEDLKKRVLTSGESFLAKQAVKNEEFSKAMNETNNAEMYEKPGVEGESASFKFAITPKWGYTNPTLVSYRENNSPIAVIPSIEVEQNNLHTLGNYSWFNKNYQDRKEVSPFQYVLFLPSSMQRAQEQRALNVNMEPIQGSVSNNNEYPNIVGTLNPVVEGDGNFNLVTKDTISFSQNFEAPKRNGETFVGFSVEIRALNNPFLPANYVQKIYKNAGSKEVFKIGDNLSLADYIRHEANALEAKWKEHNALTKDEQNRLAFLMYSANLDVKVKLEYATGTPITGWINTYLQDMTNPSLEYLTTATVRKRVQVMSNSNITLNDIATTYVNPNDHYTYYLNKENMHSVSSATKDDQELASLKYDRGLTVEYLDEQGNLFNGISDSTIYKTYSGSNRAVIQFPVSAQFPLGKIFDYWEVEKRNNDNIWVSDSNLQIKQEENKDYVYPFSSGIDGKDKSIRLRAVWKNITPDAYVVIPKNIVLKEEDTNLTPASAYAGTKVTIGYRSVNNTNARVNVDVLKNFNLSLSSDFRKTIEVKSYNSAGQLMQMTGINNAYARIGELNELSTQQEVWFNTAAQPEEALYKGTFAMNIKHSEIKSNSLFYISSVAP